MSKYLKGFFNKPNQGKKNESSEEAQLPETSQPSKPRDPLERPFEINTADLWKYDVEELSDFIQMYEKYVGTIKQYFSGTYKEVTILKEKLEISEQERKSLEQEVIQMREMIEHLQTAADKAPPLSQPVVTAEGGETTGIIPGELFNFETIVQRHFDSDKVASIPALSEIHIMSATIMSQLEELFDDVRGLQKTTWTDLVEIFKGEDDEDHHSEEAAKPEEPISQQNEAATTDRASENGGEHPEARVRSRKVSFGEDTHRDIKDAADIFKRKIASRISSKVNSLAGSPVTLHAKEEGKHDDDEAASPGDDDGVFLLDDRFKNALAHVVKNIESEMKKVSGNITGFVSKVKDLEEQANTAFVNDLRKIFTGGPNSGANLTSYVKELEDYIAELKVSAQNSEISKDKANISAPVDKKELEKVRRQMDIQLSELNQRLADERRKNQDLANQVQSMENETGDIEDTVTKLKRNNLEAEGKISRLEKQVSDLKEVEKELEEKLRASEDSISTKDSELTMLYNKVEELDKHVSDLIRSRNSLNEEIKLLKEEINIAASGQENAEQSQMELTTVKVEANSLRDEIDRLEKQVEVNDRKKVDLENKIIQERLRVDTLKKEQQKTEENYKEARQDLSEQVSKSHENIRKMEHLELEYNETRKKMKEYRKNARKLSQQVADLQSSLKEQQDLIQKLQADLVSKTTESKEDETEFDNGEIAAKNIKIHELTTQTRELLDKNGELIRAKEELAIKLTASQEDLDKVTSQFTILKEKREAGVKEIKRLNTIVEQVKAGNTGIALQKLAVEESYPVKVTVLDEVKKSLEGLYKDYLNSIQYDKLEEQQTQPNITSPKSAHISDRKKGIITGIVIPDTIVRVEKRINDTILAVEEYLQSITSPSKSKNPSFMTSTGSVA